MTAEELIAAAEACEICGKMHQFRALNRWQKTWAAPDGHPYRPRLAGLTGHPSGKVIEALKQLAAR